jgi:glutamate synthase (ferredoxin)
MTGGKVIILGKTGRNFAAGMSGGIAYIYDKENNFINGLCNTESIDFENLSNEDNIHLKHHINEHVKYTNSGLGKKILSNWRKESSHFIKVMPTEYKKALENILKDQKTINKLL